MLCGLLRPDQGQGTCLGFDVRIQSAQIKREVGYMPQRFGLYEDLTIEENLVFVARVYGIPNRAAAITSVISELGLGAFRHHLAGAVSGGWKQRLALAACLLHKPKLLLLDEPTAGVDPQSRREFWSHIHQLCADGMTALVSTHYMDEAERCNNLVYVSAGKVLATGTPQSLLQQSNLRSWRISGSGLQSIARGLTQPSTVQEWFSVPFGTSLHVTTTGNERLENIAAVSGFLQGCAVQEVEPQLEDFFISLTRRPANFQIPRA